MPDYQEAIDELDQALQAHEQAAQQWPHVKVVVDGAELLDVPLVDVIGAGANPLGMADDDLVVAVEQYLSEREIDVDLRGKVNVYRAESGSIVIGPEAYLGSSFAGY